MRTCKQLKKDGNPCGANSQIGKSVCVFHDPEKREQGQKARRAGGLTRSRPRSMPKDSPDMQLGSARELAAFLSDSINQVRRGELEPRTANTVGYLSSLLLKALEQSVLEERLDRIERSLGIAEGGRKEATNEATNRKAN